MRRAVVGPLIGALTLVLWGGGSAPLSAGECARVVGAEWNPETISTDPAYFAHVPDIQLVRMIYDPFIDLDSKLQPIPVLAQSWESTADGTQWLFRLRDGVTFHDGSSLTADDVVYTYRRLLDPETKSPALAELQAFDPENFQAVDAKTVKVTLASPQFELPTVLATMFALVVKNQASPSQVLQHPNGTGPFMLPDFAPGAAKYVLARNPKYWREGLPRAECIELSAITDAVSRVAALLSGAADVATTVDPATAATTKDNPALTLVPAPSGTALTMGMFIDTPPFNDPRVRQALKLVIDRKAMVSTALLGFGFAGNDNPVPPSSPDAYRSDVIPRDIAKVKQLLADAGYPDGIAVDLNIADTYPGTLGMAQTYREMAAEAGIKINLLVSPASEYWDAIWLKKPFTVSNWGARPTSTALAVAYRRSAKWNETHWLRDDYDALLDKAAATADPAERRKLYQNAQRMLAEEGGVIIPIFSTVMAVLRSSCAGYQPPADHNRPVFVNVVCK